MLGAIFFGANMLAAVSALAAARIAARIGLINTMVFTHLPSNVLLMLVPLMPTVELAILVLLARFSISQMDVPTRQSYTMAVVDPDERSAAAGVTGIARTTGAALSPLIAAPLFAVPGLASVPFFLAGGLKIVYDLALWRAFRSRRAPEDPRRQRSVGLALRHRLDLRQLLEQPVRQRFGIALAMSSAAIAPPGVRLDRRGSSTGSPTANVKTTHP